MGMFWLGFVIGFLAFLMLLIALVMGGSTKESDAQRVAREVREAKQQIDRLFAETKHKMAAATDRETPAEHEPGDEPGVLREAWRRTQ